MKYLLITPVKNEETFIRSIIESINDQTVCPSKWIIVNDGSTDNTREIIEEYLSKQAFMELINLPSGNKREAGGEGVVQAALDAVDISHYDFIGRFDADIVLQRNYIAGILDEFAKDQRLGIAGGLLYIIQRGKLKAETHPEYHVRGAVKMYRRRCFEDIGDLKTYIGWDTIDEVSAWAKGWSTKTFSEYKVLHLRPTGKGIFAPSIFWQRGRAEYLSWSHPLFVLLKSLRLLLISPNPVKALAFLGGFFSCYLHATDRLQDERFVRTRRGQQFERIRKIQWRHLKPSGMALDFQNQ